VQLDSTQRRTPSDLSGLYVRGRGGELVQLDAVAHVHEGVGPRQLNHFNRVRDFTLTAGLAPGFALGEALDSLDRVARTVLPRGMETVAAAVEAGRIRLRPILMTSVATIMGALPVAMGLGAGSASRRPLGYAIVGGIFFSTVLTLFVVPVAYLLLDRLQTARQPRGLQAGQPVEAD